jgi:hypothetical protein
MIPKKTPQQILLENASFIKVNQSYINAILIAKLQDFVEIKTTFCSPIEDIKKTTLEVSIKHVEKIINVIHNSTDNVLVIRNYLDKLKHVYKFRTLNGFQGYQKPKPVKIAILKNEKFKAAEKALVKVKESLNVSPEVSIMETTEFNTFKEKINWDKEKLRKDLDEAYIMEHHAYLCEETKDIYETKSDYLKRVKELPVIQVNKNVYDSYQINLLKIEDIQWSQTNFDGTKYEIHPDKNFFEKGRLAFKMSYFETPLQSVPIYIKDKYLVKRGLSKIETNREYYVVVVNLFKSIYRSKIIQTAKPLSEILEISNNINTITITYKDHSQSTHSITGVFKHINNALIDNAELRLIREGKYSLHKILKNNKFSKQSERSLKFDNWLKENNYIK